MVLHAAVAAAVLRCMNRLLRMTSAGAVVVQSALLLLGGGASLRAGLGGREDGSLGRQAGPLPPAWWEPCTELCCPPP